MANYRKRYSNLTGKWTPVAAVTKTLTTRKVAERIEKESTVSIADIMAVLYALPHVLRDEMANGYSVKLDGIGSFALTVQCHKTGVDRAEDVNPYTQITNVKVQFRPEKTELQLANMEKKKKVTSLVANDITWSELQERKGTKNAGNGSTAGTGTDEEEPPTGGGDTPGGGDNPGGGGDNPGGDNGGDLGE